jgi:hypothetical protein
MFRPVERDSTFILNVFMYLENHTDRSGVVDTPAPYSGGPGFDSEPRRRAIVIEVLRGFPHSLQANSGIQP